MAPGSPPSRWFDDPPPADGAKVIITDTDHYAPGKGDALWAWKSFLRGHHPILMDFGLIGGFDPPDRRGRRRWIVAIRVLRARALRDGRHPAVRRADGPHRDGAARRPDVDRLRAGAPRARSTSSSSRPATVSRSRSELEPGAYDVEWFSVTARQTNSAEAVTVDQTGSIDFTAPFDDGPAVLYLRRSEARGTTAG